MPEVASAAPPALDTLYRVEAPEGVALALRPAGIGARCLAYTLDLLIRMVVMGTLGAIVGSFKGVGQAFWLIGFFLLEWFYPVVFELSRSAATPGKMALGLRVVMDNGLPITAGASLVRNLLRAVDLMPAAYGFALLCLLVRHDFKRLGDLAASTLVVYRPERKAAPEWPSAKPQPPTTTPNFAQQRALMHLAGRCGRLTTARADELASLVVPVLWPRDRRGDPHFASPSERAIGVARWLRGDRPDADD